MEPAAVGTLVLNRVFKVMTVHTWRDFKEEVVSGQALNNGGEFANKEIGKGRGKGEDHVGDTAWHRS